MELQVSGPSGLIRQGSIQKVVAVAGKYCGHMTYVVLAHLDQGPGGIKVADGSKVSAGQVVGRAGYEGHVHNEMYVSDEQGVMQVVNIQNYWKKPSKSPCNCPSNQGPGRCPNVLNPRCACEECTCEMLCAMRATGFFTGDCSCRATAGCSCVCPDGRCAKCNTDKWFGEP